MNYKQSGQILKAVKKSRKIILNVHRNADLDSIGSASAVYQVLLAMNKKVIIVSPQEPVLKILKGINKIKVINFSRFDFSGFDLFLALDVSSYDRITGDKSILLPENLPFIVIDHHNSNSFNIPIKIVEEDANSTTEIIYKLFSDWKVKINKDIATSLLAGIIGDTVFFRYTKNDHKLFEIVSDLIKLGADKDLLVDKVFDNLDYSVVKLIGRFLESINFEKSGFIWTAVDYETYVKFKKPAFAREMVADIFFRSIRGVEFGIVMLEEERDRLSVSFRSKNYTDVSVLAKTLGGGGHKNAAGCTIKDTFSNAVNYVIRKTVLFAKSSQLSGH